MTTDLTVQFVGALLGLISAAAAQYAAIHFKRKATGERSYSERLKELTGVLAIASRKVDEVLREISDVAREKELAVQGLARELETLEGQHAELRDRVEALQNVPLHVADHLAKIVGSGERRSARRDYMLFGAGVLVSTAISILLRALGWG